MIKNNKFFVIMIIVAMLSNYFTIIGEIGSIVKASEESLSLNMNSEEIAEEEIIEESEESPYKQEMLGDCMDLKSTLDNGERYKGILLANKFLDDQHKSEFKFKNTIELNIKKHADIGSFVIDESEFVISNGEQISFSNYINYDYLSISEAEFKSLFEDRGYIAVYNDSNEEIARIDSHQVSVDGMYKLEFVKGISNLKFRVIGIKEDGNLRLELGKKIINDLPFSREEIELFDGIVIEDRVTIFKTNNETSEDLSIETVDETVSDSVENVTVEDTISTEEINEELNNTEIPANNTETTNEIVEPGLSLSTKTEQIVENQKPEENNSEITLDLGDSDKYFNFVNMISAEKKDLNSEETITLDMEEAEEKNEVIPETEESVEIVETIDEEVLPETTEISNEEVLEIENEIVLNNSQTKVELEMSTYEFSTTEETEVNFNVKLMSNGEKYDLYKDPYVEIIFPTEMENVTVDNVNVLYKNGIDIDHYLVEKNELGENVLKLILTGTQEEYATGIIDGITISFDATMEISDLTTSKKTNIMYRYSNEYANHILYQEDGFDSENVEIGLIGENGILKSMVITDLDTNQILLNSFNKDRNIEDIYKI